MLVDIILPIYKPDENIFKSIDSVLQQNYKNWHLYIIDDASEDNWLDRLVQRFGDYNGKISYYRLKVNSRAAACRNYAIKKGHGKYIAFIDQDDIWVKQKLMWQIEYLEKTKYDAVHGNLKFIDKHDKVILIEEWKRENETRKQTEWNKLSNYELANKILIEPNLRLISCMITRNIYEKIGGFKEQFFGGEDELFWFEIATIGRIGYIDKVLFYRREHEKNTVKAFQLKRLYGYYKVLIYIKNNYNHLVDYNKLDEKIREKIYLIFKFSIKFKNIPLFLFVFMKILISYPSVLIQILKVLKRKTNVLLNNS